MRLEIFIIPVDHVLCYSLQFEMSSGGSSERTERADGFVDQTRCSQHIGLSEDCDEFSSGESECRESVGDSTFLRDSERALGETHLLDEPERVSESGVGPLAEDLILTSSGDLPETDPGDRSHPGIVSNIRLSELAVRGDRQRGSRTVTFNPEVTVHYIPVENRQSEWMRQAIDRAHFQRRIDIIEELLTFL